MSCNNNVNVIPPESDTDTELEEEQLQQLQQQIANLFEDRRDFRALFQILFNQVGDLRDMVVGNFARVLGRVERLEGRVDHHDRRLDRLEGWAIGITTVVAGFVLAFGVYVGLSILRWMGYNV